MGPIWVLYGQKSLSGAHVGPKWDKCPDSAHMGPIYTCLLDSTQAVIQTHKSVNESRIRMFRPTDIDPRIKGAITRPRIVSFAHHAHRPEQRKYRRSVCPDFWKSTYGSSMAKTSETILETATL